MISLRATTEDFVKLERSQLAANATAGSSVSLTLENNNGISDTDFLVIGHEGSELAELVQVNAVVVDGQSVQVTTLKFNHFKGEPVTRYSYNKRKFYGCATETGTYVELTSEGSPVDIQVDDPQGTLLEYLGSTYLYFKSTYYNSTSATETDIADALAVAGDQSGRYASLYEIRKHAGLAGNPFYSDVQLERKRKNAENEIQSALVGRYTLPLAAVPGLINQICTLLAAGYIDYEEFGSEGEGAKWLGEARSLLKNIVSGKRLLLGEDGTELERIEGTAGVDGYPDDADTDGRIFSMSDKY